MSGSPSAISIIVTLLVTAVQSGTVLLLPTVGEIFTERSGILNLGIEGMMLIGAFFGFVTAYRSGNPYAGLLAGAVAGACAAMLHAFVCITLRGNQTVSGLALSIFGAGLTGFYGDRFISQRLPSSIPSLEIPGLSRIPVIGPIFFDQDIVVYASYVLVAGLWFVLYRTRPGVHLRAVGENAKAADAMGVNVSATRYFWTCVGGALAGLGGAYMTCRVNPFWLQGITSGQGWIAVALVVFAMWNPLTALGGSYLFGSIMALQFQLQAAGVSINANLLAMLPYVVTFVVIVVATLIVRVRHLGTPHELGHPYVREEK